MLRNEQVSRLHELHLCCGREFRCVNDGNAAKRREPFSHNVDVGYGTPSRTTPGCFRCLAVEEVRVRPSLEHGNARATLECRLRAGARKHAFSHSSERAVVEACWVVPVTEDHPLLAMGKQSFEHDPRWHELDIGLCSKKIEPGIHRAAVPNGHLHGSCPLLPEDKRSEVAEEKVVEVLG